MGVKHCHVSRSILCSHRFCEGTGQGLSSLFKKSGDPNSAQLGEMTHPEWCSQSLSIKHLAFDSSSSVLTTPERSPEVPFSLKHLGH